MKEARVLVIRDSRHLNNCKVLSMTLLGNQSDLGMRPTSTQELASTLLRYRPLQRRVALC